MSDSESRFWGMILFGPFLLVFLIAMVVAIFSKSSILSNATGVAMVAAVVVGLVAAVIKGKR